ncbi:MAG: transporter, ATP-binding protein [Crocinitomicaceae bacterium]|jgi:lipopolysaccharide transport system ATP-binding protein|nr:transporter, ATP-binding protein [Crocinitomicaceae bacterium]
MSKAIKVEHLSKIYQLGQIGTGTFSQDLHRWYSRMRGKEDPFLIIGEKNDRAQKGSNIVYSLKDINFEINQGQAVGIIGKNGAGKSTLLKILSRVTRQSQGNIYLKGRIASLLEVGTGFHPELSGRENIFLNGAILGMRKTEIKRKLDEIIDFSGVERYIDTPVKRYSSGMYVRLAFAVAAHLDSEILIVDEVLAVGDFEFQKKCLGKMGDVSRQEGRTVLFVSHNMGAISQLCTSMLLLEQGELALQTDDVRKAINRYLSDTSEEIKTSWENPGKQFESPYFLPLRLKVASASLQNGERNSFSNEFPVRVTIDFEVKKWDPSLEICFWLYNDDGQLVFTSTNSDTSPGEWPEIKTGENSLAMDIPARFLNEGSYILSLSSSLTMKEWLIHPEKSTVSVRFSIKGGLSDSPTWYERRDGILAPVLTWKKA